MNRTGASYAAPASLPTIGRIALKEGFHLAWEGQVGVGVIPTLNAVFDNSKKSGSPRSAQRTA
jgi:hypothetical protein